MASSASGLVRLAMPERVLPAMVGMGRPSRLQANPAAMPSNVGLVRMPFTLFFSFAVMLPAWAASGPSSIRMTTAITLYSGTLPRIIILDISAVP